MPGVRSLLIGVLLLMVAAACGPAPAPSSSATPSGSAAPAPSGSTPGSAASPGTSGTAPAADAAWLPEWADNDVPAEIANRTPLRFCGLEKAPAPTPGEYIDPVVRACFWDVWHAGGQAEFASVQSTMEGDPIATIYRLAPDGTIEVLVDGSRDRFGSGGWTLTRCASLVEDAEGQAFFGTADCDEAIPIE